MIKKVLFFGRHDCLYSQKIYSLLKKNFDNVTFIKSKEMGKKLDENKRKYKKNFDYVFCFRSYFILNKILKRVKFFAINFHPCTPKYRGAGGVNYSIYNDKYFGCTAHLMDKNIDSGKIIDVKYFKIKKKDTLEKVLKKTYKLQFQQAIRVVNGIKKDERFIEKQLNKNKLIKWSNKFYTMKMLEKFYEINFKISKKNFLKKLKSTVIGKHKPYIVLHGKKFIFQNR